MRGARIEVRLLCTTGAGDDCAGAWESCFACHGGGERLPERGEPEHPRTRCGECHGKGGHRVCQLINCPHQEQTIRLITAAKPAGPVVDLLSETTIINTKPAGGIIN